MNTSPVRQKILIVDDKKANLFALKKVLKDVDADVVQAIDGQAALVQVLDHNFALIILDVRMPDMDGYEVAQHLRGDRNTKDIPIIFVTAEYPDEEHMFRGYEAGAIDYMLKPYSSKILLSKVNVLLEMDRNRTELQRHQEELEALVAERTSELTHLARELEVKNRELEAAKERLEILARTDPLTGLFNRRFFMEQIEKEYSAAVRHQRPLSLVMADLDHFKSVNDTFGHQAGDEALRTFASVVRECCRKEDIVARYGGEEFICLLPDTPDEHAAAFAERLRATFEQTSILGLSRCITVSLGVAELVAPETIESFLKRADDAMYRAKNEGRNRVASSISLNERPDHN